MRAGAELDRLVLFIAHLLGRAHARGARALDPRGAPLAPWSTAEMASVIDHAAALAGMFEAIALAHARLRP